MLPSPNARHRLLIGLAVLALVAPACSDDDSTPAVDNSATTTSATSDPEPEALPSVYRGHVSEVYADEASWLCKPGIVENVCERDLDSTAVFADGSTEVRPHVPAADPETDCFYVYPTTSGDDAANSDLDPDEAEEIYTTYNQAARYGSVCRVFAPVYRQRTLNALLGAVEAPEGVDPGEIAYGDVVDAFRHYMANDNDGRGVILIGHSQGASVLRRLLADEIEPEPVLLERLVSAHLLGTSVGVPEGDVVGGSLDQVPLCTARDEAGCVVTYASFRHDAPPPENSLFGRAREDDRQAGCVHPADPAVDVGEAVTLEPYVLVEPVERALGDGAQPFSDPARTAEITTPWVTWPDFVSGACVQDGEFSYLALTVMGDPSDPRTDDIGGDLTPQWGMHLVDMSVAMGDLVALAQSQADAWVAGQS